MPRYRVSGRQANLTTGRNISGALLSTQHTFTSRAKPTFSNNSSLRAFIMDDPNTNTNSETKLPCHRFAAAGNCNGCQNEHHPNLDPALVGMVAPQQYRVPNEVGVACLACMEKLREVSCISSVSRMILTWHSVTSSLTTLQMSAILAQNAVTLAVRRHSARLHQTPATTTQSIDRCSFAATTSTSLSPS
jgi:hypothetical protein